MIPNTRHQEPFRLLFRLHMSVSLPPSRVGETTRENTHDLPRVRPREHLDSGNPLDPLEAAPTGGDETQGKTMIVRELFLSNVCCQQCLPRLFNREAPTVAGDGDEADIACITVR